MSQDTGIVPCASPSSAMPPVVIALIITYERTDLAVETIRSVKSRVQYPNIGFHIADDGSRPGHINRLLEEIGPTYAISVSNSRRRGVGSNMNLGMASCLRLADFILWLEDDWVIPNGQMLDLRPCVQLMLDVPRVGMVRLGRLSAGLAGVTIAGADLLWWELSKGKDTYVFTGNAALRHRRFCQSYGPYPEGLRPGETELAMCAKFNSTDGPSIVWPAWLTQDRMFQHIGDHQSFKYCMESEGMSGEQAAGRFAALSAEGVH